MTVGATVSLLNLAKSARTKNRRSALSKSANRQGCFENFGRWCVDRSRCLCRFSYGSGRLSMSKRLKMLPKNDKTRRHKKYIAPYFCFIQSSGMGKTKLMYEFAQLTRHEDENNDVCKDISCNLVLSGDILLEKADPVFDCELR
jgi:hypothetical protein